ncbi:MAG TPA: RNA polymerase sigma factor [Thermoanaerobaculia bacterium]|nr:RNA polymerase sigma factor [Thermoanaerobaculia bacterium]
MAADFLTQLKFTKGDQAQDWLVMEQSLTRLSHEIQRAIWAAAIPHWFDVDFLSYLLEERAEILAADFDAITHLSFVERFPDLGFNIHEHSRKLLLTKLWQNNPSQFVHVSNRAQAYCSQKNDAEPAWRIEQIYHSLSADPEKGLKLFTDQVRTWRTQQLDERAESLIKTALEVAEAGRITSKAKETIELAYASLQIVYGRKEPRGRNDQEIVKDFLAGKAEAVGTVDGWITRAAWPYQRRLSNRWEDVLQDIRLEVTRLLFKGSFRGESSLRTYLWRVVSHTCLDYLRAANKWRWSDLENPEDPDSVVRRYVDQETDDLPLIRRKEAEDLLARVLERAPHDCRVMWQMILAGLTYREMSSKLGIAERTIRVRILRCRERAEALRSELLS